MFSERPTAPQPEKPSSDTPKMPTAGISPELKAKLEGQAGLDTVNFSPEELKAIQRLLRENFEAENPGQEWKPASGESTSTTEYRPQPLQGKPDLTKARETLATLRGENLENNVAPMNPEVQGPIESIPGISPERLAEITNAMQNNLAIRLSTEELKAIKAYAQSQNEGQA